MENNTDNVPGFLVPPDEIVFKKEEPEGLKPESNGIGKVVIVIIAAILFGIGIGHLVCPDQNAQDLQDFTSQVSYLTGRIDQSVSPVDNNSVMTVKVACKIFYENKLDVIPGNYHPEEFYNRLSALCQDVKEDIKITPENPSKTVPKDIKPDIKITPDKNGMFSF
jgi:hypothetical protein